MKFCKVFVAETWYVRVS